MCGWSVRPPSLRIRRVLEFVMSAPNESTVEEAALEWFGEVGHSALNGDVIAPGESQAERESGVVDFGWKH